MLVPGALTKRMHVNSSNKGILNSLSSVQGSGPCTELRLKIYYLLFREERRPRKVAFQVKWLPSAGQDSRDQEVPLREINRHVHGVAPETNGDPRGLIRISRE